MFDVDLKGLAKLIEDAGPARLIAELIANSFDEGGVTRVSISITAEPGRPLACVSVEDDAPNGFADLSHSWTLFAESYKKAYAEKAGRFNLGDKLFLAAAVLTGQPARILTTSGGVEFGLERGKPVRSIKRNKLPRGSVVGGYLKMTRDQLNDQVIPFIRSILIPPHICVSLNGDILEARVPFKTFKSNLPTVLADDEGVLRPTKRDTVVELFEVRSGETAQIFELGIPVVETGDRYHVNICQKVPLNFNRDNVTPAYLRTIRTLVLNETFDQIKEANDNWVREAASDERVSPEAIDRVLTLRFGDKRVAYDPNDQEANANATANGFKVIHGRELNSGEWINVRGKAPVTPAGQMFPTAKPYGPGGAAAEFLDPSEFTPGMQRIVEFTEWLHEQLTGASVTVRINTNSTNFAACYIKEQHELHYSLKVLGKKWFDPDNLEAILKLFIHETGHYYCSSHLDEKYHEGLCQLGADLAALCLKAPTVFRDRLKGK